MPRPPAEPARAARDGRRHAACRRSTSTPRASRQAARRSSARAGVRLAAERRIREAGHSLAAARIHRPPASIRLLSDKHEGEKHKEAASRRQLSSSAKGRLHVRLPRRSAQSHSSLSLAAARFPRPNPQSLDVCVQTMRRGEGRSPHGGNIDLWPKAVSHFLYLWTIYDITLALRRALAF